MSDMSDLSPLQQTAPIVLGRPQFDDPALAEVARRHGDLAAWQRAFERDGAKAAAGVRGSFAVAFFDGRGRGFMAVDRFAEHSLCWRLDDSGPNGPVLRFSERADALADAAPRIDPQALFDYLYFHVIPSPRTVFAGVQRLPPGCSLLFENSRASVQPYWVPSFDEPRGAVSFDALRDEFRTLLRESVADRLDGGKAGCFLSGGTDSSTVAGMIREATGKPAATYSIGFEAQGYDEMGFARIAAKHFATEHHEYYVTPADLVRSIGDVAASYDQPFGNSSALPAYYCAKMARDDGVTRLLAGDGGDELFGGNTRYAKQRIFGWYGLLPSALRSGLMEPLLETSVAGRLPLLRKGASYVEQAKVPMPDRLQMYNLLLRLGPADVLTDAFLAQIDPQAPARQQREVWALPLEASAINRTLAYDWRYTLAESDLPKVSGTTRLADVDVAFPFLDDRLLQFSLKLPSEYKLKGLKLRWFFKEALRGFLPDEILAKKKQGFGLPFGVWANRDEALKQLATGSLDSLAGRGIVRPEFIRQLVDVHLPQYPGYYGEMVWILMMMEQWLQRHAPDWRL